MSAPSKANKREKISLGHSHMELSGRMVVQDMESERNGASRIASVADAKTVAGAAGDVVEDSAVDVDGLAGQITVTGLTVADGNATTFPIIVRNKSVRANAIVMVTGDGSNAVYASVSAVAAGTFSVTITNVSGDALDADVILKYLVINP